MDKNLKINTHHAYLNTDIILSSKLPSVDLKDEQTGMEYHIEDKPLVIKLSAGKHRLYCESLGEELNVVIEDAIKLGGSNVKKSFVFDENPWVFVVTKDRLYATNIETNEEKVEFNITPDEIHAHSNYYGKPCEYFLFKTKKDYSIYDVTTGSFIITFMDYIYSNSHLVIYKKDEDVVVFNYRQKRTIVEFSGQYSFGKKFYFVKEGKLNGLNLNTDYKNVIYCVGKVTEDAILYKDSLLMLYYDYRDKKRYYLYSLGNGENGITKAEIVAPMYIESLCGIETKEYLRLRQDYNQYDEEKKVLLSKNYNFDICCNGLRIEEIKTTYVNNKMMLCLSGHIVSYPKKSYEIPFVMRGEYGGELNFKNALFESNNQSIFESAKEEENIELGKGVKLLGTSESKNLIVTLSDDVIMLRNRKTNEQYYIFKDSFDTTSYNSAYFTSDGKNVVFIGKDKSMGILGFENMTQQPFEVEGATVARNAGFNGYTPEIDIQVIDGRKPVWRDPISLKWITDEDMSNHIFKSPDGRYSADIQEKTVYYNRLTKQEISLDEYIELKKRYNWTSDAPDEEKKSKAALRESLLNKYGRDVLFHYIHEQNNRLIHLTKKSKLTDKQIEARIVNLNKSDEDEYISSKPDFLPLFIDILGYVCYHEHNGEANHRILIGRSVWFLNYVSFSYDSRYLAFGAKMKEDTWRFSEEGVFELYDLEENKIVDRKDTNIDLQAVWMTMFSKCGDVAYYDSHANTMVAYAESNYQYTNTAKGKSLLCISPSGKYIALSDQNYISYKYHSKSNWGHQPSGNIYIYDMYDLETCQEQYNDFGEGVDGTIAGKRRHGNVASAAFSCDDERLLAVGDDGVIVIRNLCSPFVDAFEDAHCLRGGSYEKHYYRKNQRNGIVSVTFNSPDGEGVTTEFVNFWCKPDETLDIEHNFVLSKDCTEIKNSLDITINECHIPDGIKKIGRKVFHGMYGTYENADNALIDLYLPDSIESIEETFEQCPMLQKIHVSINAEEKIKSILPGLADKITHF